jgi:chaperonin GroEL (HSP60 family)
VIHLLVSSLCFHTFRLVCRYVLASIEHADFDGVERLALVTGGEICSTFDDPAGNVLGTCDKVEEIMIGEDKLIKFSGVAKGEVGGCTSACS